MAAEWFLAREGQPTVGPITAPELKGLAVSGQVPANSLVWKAGMPRWVPATQVKGLLGGSGEFATVPPAPEPAPPRETDGRTVEPPPAPDVPAAEEDRRPEPWFYGFLDRYAPVAMWVAVVTCSLGFVG